MMCGAPLPGGGLCATCGTVGARAGAAACATCAVLPRNRLESLGLKRCEAISASDGEAVALERAVAVAMCRHLADAEFEASERCDLALSLRSRS